MVSYATWITCLANIDIYNSTRQSDGSSTRDATTLAATTHSARSSASNGHLKPFSATNPLVFPMKIAPTPATALRFSLCPSVFLNLSTPQSRSSLQIRCASASSTTDCFPPRIPSYGSHKGAVGSIGRCLLGCAAAAATLLTSFSFNESPALAESLTVAFPVSRAREVNNVQKTLVEAWGLIRETFYDPSFNHQDWDLALQQTMIEMLPLDSSDAAYTKISAMLSSLGDPFTRIITPKEFQRFQIGSEGNIQGVGLYITKDENTGQLMVMSCVDGSPAARAGIHNGDQLIEINGEKLDGMNSETAASRLRGLAGTAVKLKIRPANEARARVREVNLPREVINLSPVSSVIIAHRSRDGRVVKTGYVKLASFSQNAATCMADAVRELEEQKVQSYILDLRNNPGGLVTAGLDVAQIWLDGDETLVNTIDRDGNLFPIIMTDGHALTKAPLVVLVNEKSASATEILAGALHDNGRAILVGHKTFGKGKIQSVTELHDGAALFITVAKYLSPARHEIDQVGITPDVQCTTRMLNASKLASLESDNCILVAEHELDVHKVTGTAS